MTLYPYCGPHCGTKDKKEGHCQKCHQRRAHGNITVRQLKELDHEIRPLLQEEPG